jgi:tRNA threonylcarbamoyladenosine biosynthesis protein TsaE
MQVVFTLDEIASIARRILSCNLNRIVLLDGNMGSGKTTLVKSMLAEMGVRDVVDSPTFSLVNEYDSPQGKIYHFDFYRLKSAYEALDIGFDEYLESGCYCFIEWPEIVKFFIPDNHSTIQIEVLNDNSRLLSLI